MTVADLQRHLIELSRLLDSSGGSAGAAELRHLADGFHPFREQSLNDFAAFLARPKPPAEPAAEPRKPPPVEPATPPPVKPPAKAKKKGAVDVASVAASVRSLYDQAASPSMTRERIDRELEVIKPLSKDALKQVAQAIEIKVPGGWGKEKIAQEIALKIHTRRDVAGRAQLHGIPEPSPKK